MKAPSEKHLEDWIVANPEWFGTNSEYDAFLHSEFDAANCRWVSEDRFVLPTFTKIIARQPRLPVGLPDLITTNDYQLHVVELKAGAIDSKTITQCLRYMACLKEIMTWVVIDRGHEIDGFSPRRNSWQLSGYSNDDIAGIVVGSHVEDYKLYWVAAQAGIEIFTYDYHADENLYTFERTNIERLEDLPRSTIYREWAQGALGDALVSASNFWHNMIQEQKKNKLNGGAS